MVTLIQECSSLLNKHQLHSYFSISLDVQQQENQRISFRKQEQCYSKHKRFKLAKASVTAHNW